MWYLFIYLWLTAPLVKDSPNMIQYKKDGTIVSPFTFLNDGSLHCGMEFYYRRNVRDAIKNRHLDPSLWNVGIVRKYKFLNTYFYD